MSFTSITTSELQKQTIGTISLSPSKRRKLSETAIEPTSNELWKWTLSREAIAPCFIQDALEMKENPTKDADFYWLGRIPCRSVRIVAIVVGVQVYEKRIRYTVDDGTAVIDCLHKAPLPPRSPVKNSQGNNTYLKPQSKPFPEPKPVARVGHLVSITGRVTRKFDTREIIADSIEQCLSWNDEPRHWLEVRRLHRENYSLSTPFEIPARPSSPVEPSTPTHRPSTRVQTPVASSGVPSGMPAFSGNRTTSSTTRTTPSTIHPTPSTTHTMTPSSSSQASSPAKSIATQSPQKLRHPSRLHSRDLNSNTFRIYVKHYMDRTAYVCVEPTPELDGDSEVDTYSEDDCPASPSKRSHCHANDTTPRPNSSRTPISVQTPRPRITPLSYDGIPHPQRRSVTNDRAHMQGFTLSYLRRVPELADMAQRVVKAVTKRRIREERQKAKETAATGSASHSSTRPIPSTSTGSRAGIPSTQTEGKSGPRIKRLFQATIVQLLREGSIVLWDGPTRPCCDSKEQTSGLWKGNVTSTSMDSTVFSASSVSMTRDGDSEEIVLSEPESNEESYVPLSPAFLASVVEEAIRKLTRAPDVVKTRYGAMTKEGILAYLSKDDQWRYLSEWNIGEALEVLKGQRRVRLVGRGLWELNL